MNNRKKILITGGCGYIGSHTAIYLLSKGYEVISIDNFSRSLHFIPERIRTITGRPFVNYAVDCCDIKAIENVLNENKGVSGIIHFAAFKSVNESVKNPLLYFENNIQSTIQLLRAAEKYKIDHFVFSSSCSVYGNVRELPVKETTPVAEPESPYGLTKLISEQIIQSFSPQAHAHFISLRYFNPAGAHESGMIGEIPFGDPENLVPNITAVATGRKNIFIVHGNDYPTRDGSCVRDYVHVMDIAEAHGAALEYLMQNKDSGKYDIFNLGSGNGFTVLEMIKAFERATGKSLHYEIGKRREGDVVAIYADNSKAKKILNWLPKYDIDEMMRSAWNWEMTVQKEHITGR